jgi:hypothetical protein
MRDALEVWKEAHLNREIMLLHNYGEIPKVVCEHIQIVVSGSFYERINRPKVEPLSLRVRGRSLTAFVSITSIFIYNS